MKARFSYSLAFFLPSAMVAFLAAFIVAGGGAGILWLFVYGHNTWPETAGKALMVLAAATSLATLATLVFASYSFGKRREALGGISKQHTALAIVISILLPAVALLHQWQVGNLG